MRIDSSRRSLRVLAVVAAASAALAACSSQGGAQNQTGGGGEANQGGSGQDLTFAMVTHEAAGDTFWDKIRAGAEAAAANTGVTLQYSNNEQAPEQSTLVQNAIDSQVDGLAVTLASPDAVGPTVKKAADAGIPVSAFNAGLDQYEQYGAKMYFGSNESLAGQTAGERITQDGGGKTICVIQQQGQVQLEARCAGVAQGHPDTENLQVDGTNLPQVQATIGSALQEDPSITHIVTLGANIAQAALQAKTDTGSQAEIITFDLSPEVAQAIKDGNMAFSIDQQPFVQGYMAVTSLYLNITNGNDIGGGGPVLTGPSIVDASNIDVILPFTQNNTR